MNKKKRRAIGKGVKSSPRAQMHREDVEEMMVANSLDSQVGLGKVWKPGETDSGGGHVVVFGTTGGGMSFSFKGQLAAEGFINGAQKG